MKSERFRTELITNVSHDIKTPLTSIINYVDLLKADNLSEEEKAQYLDVLDRQSGKLKADREPDRGLQSIHRQSNRLPGTLQLKYTAGTNCR